jgi:hypothetical protein
MLTLMRKELSQSQPETTRQRLEPGSALPAGMSADRLAASYTDGTAGSARLRTPSSYRRRGDGEWPSTWKLAKQWPTSSPIGQVNAIPTGPAFGHSPLGSDIGQLTDVSHCNLQHDLSCKPSFGQLHQPHLAEGGGCG